MSKQKDITPGNSPPELDPDRFLIDQLPDLICQWLPDGTLTFANQAYCDYFGKSLDQLVGKTCLDYIHPDDQERLAKHIAHFNHDQQCAMIELRIIDPQGDVRWHQWLDKYILDEEHPGGEFLSTGRDITASKETEQRLIQKMNFESLITKLSIDFINVSLENIDDHIDNLLREVGLFSDVDRSYVFLFDDNSGTMSNTHEWCRAGIEPQINDLQEMDFGFYDWWVAKIKNSELIQIENLSELPKEANTLKAILDDGKIRSVISVPLVNAGQVLGFIGFDAVRSNKTWSDDEINILQIISGIIGNALVQKRNQEALTRQSYYLEQINEITTASLNTRNIEEMISVIAMKIINLVEADNCSINLWDEETQKILASSYNGVFTYHQKDVTLQPDEKSITSIVLEGGGPIAIEDVSNSQLITNRLSDLYKTKALLAVPMLAEDIKLGAVLFGFEDIHKFTAEEITFAQQVTSQLSQAMLKQRLLEKAQRSAREAEMLHQAGTIVASTLDPNLAIESILDQLEQVVHFDSASVQILYDDFLEIKAGKGWPDDNSPVGTRFPVPGDNPNSKVVLSGEPYVLNNAPDVYGIFEYPEFSNIRSWLGVPLTVRDKVIGMLTLDHHDPNYYDNDQLINLVTAFADQVAISLENARLYANERQRVEELDALRATTADITKELGLKNLLHAILQRATDLMHATGGELGLSEENSDEIHILVSHQMGSNYVGETIGFDDGLMGRVGRTRQIEMIEDYKHWDGQMDSYRQNAIHAAIAAPLMIGGRFLGVIGIMNSDRMRKFSESEKNLMRMFAQQAAIAVENAKLYEERQLQARMDITTGIYNRRGLIELGNREVDRAERYNRPLAVIMVDIDRFKIVNDTYGHPVGDLVLSELAERLQANLRSIDILGRYGGEEFVILLPETNSIDAMDVAERLRSVVEAEPFKPNGLSLWITISQGVVIQSEKSGDLNEMIHFADEAMYQSKDSGRNLVTLYDFKDPD